MTRIFQTRFGDKGNCWPACLASLFEVPLEEVDQCACHHADWKQQTEEWLKARGLYCVEVPWKPEQPFPFTSPPDGTLAILGFTSQRDRKHVAIVRLQAVSWHDDGQVNRFEVQMLHDPHREPGAPKEIDCLFFIGKLFL